LKKMMSEAETRAPARAFMLRGVSMLPVSLEPFGVRVLQLAL